MRRLFYFIAIASATLAIACNSTAKKAEKAEEKKAESVKADKGATNPEIKFSESVELCTCGTCEQCLRAQEIQQEIEDVNALIAENGDNPLDKIVDKRSYAMGINLGLGANLNFGDLKLNIDDVKKYLVTFYLAGEVDSEERMQNSQNFQMYMYSMLMPYMQAKYQREAFEEGGVTEGKPELPELFNEQFTKENVTRMIGSEYGASMIDVDNFNFGWFFKGFNDALTVESAEAINSEEGFNSIFAITLQELQAEIQKISIEIQQKGRERYEKKMAANLEESKAWLAEIEKEEGVQKSESGLLYRVERKGDGAYPTADDDVVEVHYKGTIRTGEAFDSSYERDETIEFPLNRVIKGWTEGLKYINEGGKITLWIPSELAYNMNPPMGSIIEPNMALKFEVELFKVTKTETEAEQTAE